MIQFKLEASHKVLPAYRSSQVRLTGEVSSLNGAGEIPLKIAFVLDNSISMRGRKLEQAKQAAEACLPLARPQDRISVVSFCHRSQLLCHNIEGAEMSKVRDAIQGITVGPSTNMYAGVQEGLQALEAPGLLNRITRALSGSVKTELPSNRRLLLLTDGQANVGPTRPEDFRKLADTIRSKGVVLDAVGFGADYNEHVLSLMASATGGDVRHIPEREDAAAVAARFRDSFRRGATNACTEAVARLRFHPQARIGHVVGPAGHQVRGTELEIPFGEIDADPKEFTISLDVADLRPTDNLELARGVLEYRDLATGQLQQVEVQVVVRVTLDLTASLASVNQQVVAKSRLLEDISRAAESPRAATALKETLRIQGLEKSDLGRLVATLADRPADSKTLADLKSRLDRGRTKPMLT